MEPFSSKRGGESHILDVLKMGYVKNDTQKTYEISFYGILFNQQNILIQKESWAQ